MINKPGFALIYIVFFVSAVISWFIGKKKRKIGQEEQTEIERWAQHR